MSRRVLVCYLDVLKISKFVSANPVVVAASTTVVSIVVVVDVIKSDEILSLMLCHCLVIKSL